MQVIRNDTNVTQEWRLGRNNAVIELVPGGMFLSEEEGWYLAGNVADSGVVMNDSDYQFKFSGWQTTPGTIIPVSTTNTPVDISDHYYKSAKVIVVTAELLAHMGVAPRAHWQCNINLNTYEVPAVEWAQIVCDYHVRTGGKELPVMQEPAKEKPKRAISLKDI